MMFEFTVLALLQGHYQPFIDYWPWWASGGLLFGLLSWLVGNGKGQGCAGCLLGLLFGPLGLIITALMPSNRR